MSLDLIYMLHNSLFAILGGVLTVILALIFREEKEARTKVEAVIGLLEPHPYARVLEECLRVSKRAVYTYTILIISASGFTYWYLLTSYETLYGMYGDQITIIPMAAFGLLTALTLRSYRVITDKFLKPCLNIIE